MKRYNNKQQKEILLIPRESEICLSEREREREVIFTIEASLFHFIARHINIIQQYFGQSLYIEHSLLIKSL